MILSLPWPPSINHYWRHVGSKVLISAEGRSYRRAVAGACLEQRAKPHIYCRLSVKIEAYPPDKRKRDLDNLLKSTLDALQHANAILDDEAIDELTIWRMGVRKNGELRVKIQTVMPNTHPYDRDSALVHFNLETG